MPFPTLVLWIYIVLLFLGGLVGFLKAGSKISLIMSSVFAGALILCATHVVFNTSDSDKAILFILVFLMLFFSFRLVKSKKFMPNGLMSILTLAALVLRYIASH